MANASLVSPTTSHFFKPLLSGFQSHLKIPVKFFSQYIEGKHEGKTVSLISDASERIWKVKREGQRLTDGWKEFVVAHDLRIGDFVIFRHEGDLLFHVTAFGPSCCEVQYAPSHNQIKDEEESDEIGESSREEEEEEENIVENVISVYSSDLNIFSQTVTVSNLSTDTLNVPMYFARRNCLDEGGREIILMNEEGRTWASELRSFSRVRIVGGWTSFCTENKLEVGDSCTFKLLQNMEKPVFQLCSRTKPERKKETLSVEDNISGENRFVKLNLTPNNLQLGKQYLPVSFTRANMLNKPGKIILVDRNGKEWSMKLKIDSGKGYMYIMGSNGWKSFCSANGVGVGESLTLELIRGRETPLLKFCPQMEKSTFEAEARRQDRSLR